MYLLSVCVGEGLIISVSPLPFLKQDLVNPKLASSSLVAEDGLEILILLPLLLLGL